VLDRSLRGLRDISDRVLVDVRLKAGIQNLNQRVRVSEFIEEAQVAAAIDADQRGLQFIVHDIERGLEMEVDSQILAGALANLLQNAFKFTIPFGRVSLKAHLSGDRVLIEVEDECGGLQNDNHEDLFRPFEQRSGDRTGLGLGLGISRRAVEINRGNLHVRNIPGKGCVFTIDLPAVATVRRELNV
jgi:signal transduction histidine kinase